MKKYTRFFACCLAALFSAAAVYAQQGFTGPSQTGFTGLAAGQYGYTGQVQTVTVAQSQAFNDKTPVIVRGNIVQAIGGDNYIFRDSSGDIILKIGPKEWMNFGSTIGPSEIIEISGEIHRDKKNRSDIHIHAVSIRKI
ncbi:MAG: NirD/YgiW/YdeI family stress tolerance protein [Treponema sp.]|jgi:uncharacterized protein (TIGR00156 family)|nr:NirD/YgiW/YdeI family stress tolerance protein [Treponema sp.]